LGVAFSKTNCFLNIEDQEGFCFTDLIPNFQFNIPHGASLSIFQPLSFSRLYNMRSCNRPGLPCQNSMVLGLTMYPPHQSGRGMFSPNCCWYCTDLSSITARLSITALCSDAQAPSWLSCGLEEK